MKIFDIGCQCNVDGSCNKAPHLYSDPICNCDTMFRGSVDEGYLTSKTSNNNVYVFKILYLKNVNNFKELLLSGSHYAVKSYEMR